MVKKQWIAALALGFSMSAQAADFTEADAKYALRDTSIEATQQARAAYKAILDQGAKDADLIRAAEGYLRSTIFEGAHYYTTVDAEDRAARKKIFNDCWKVGAEVLSPAKLGFESPVYYYFKASCIAYEAEVSNVIQRLTLLPEMNKALESGFATQGGTTYEGGGLLRVKAAIKGNPEAKGLPGGIYNPEEALNLVDQAIASEAYPGNAEGALFCENYRRKIITLNELQNHAEAHATADMVLADFPLYLEEGLIPEFIRAETADCIKHVTELKANTPAS
ncbi:hypothetical protein [Oligoflexus tunisiensis]|uniref:hypothetical protein n=1 Tax=Oligoflexus tunisiensis TaxID=708132 RepID=UPI00114D005F|nr:hypothetical protein [Oligoflexus tunisiensis]